MGDRNKSVDEWLKEMAIIRERKISAIDVDSIRHGVSAGSIAAIFASQLNSYFERNKVDVCILTRRDLIKYLTKKGLEESHGQEPTIKWHIRKRLRAYGIGTNSVKGYVVFKKMSPTKNPKL
jgi:hypothetical protein